jgi:hypothetical protein
MNNKFDLNIFLGQISLVFIILTFAYSCANKGAGPTGGPKDETPPRVVRSIPENGSVNFNKREIMVEFDENIQLERLFENLVISPPQARNPDIRAQGRRLRIRFEEDLKDSTTYTLNFGNAVVDLNEKNVLPNFTFSFSTGSEIDTLSIAGILINAEDLNPVSGIIVGIYAEHADSVFTQKPFLRIGKTDENGYFTIDNIREGTYSIFGLEDKNRDFFFQMGEGLAMLDSLVTPIAKWVVHNDTIWTDSLTIDTIHVFGHTHFYPNDILLRFFREDKAHQRLIRSERLQPEKFTLFFNTTLAELPEIEPLNFDWNDKYILQRNNSLDTLTYWLTDSLLWSLDTLQMAITYYRTDSIFQLEQTTDTLNVVTRRTRVNPRAATRQTEPETPKRIPLTLQTNISTVFEIFNPLTVQVNEPLVEFDISMITLNEKVDTLLVPRKFEWLQTDSSRMGFAIKYDWEAEKSYVLSIDSATFISVFGKTNDEFSGSFRIRSLSEYSELKVILTNYDPRIVVQLLDSRDNVIRTQPAVTNEVIFQHLRPADYFLRLFIDENGNGIWDTGDFATRRQPEEVFYFPHRLTLRANFDFTEEWNHTAIPLLEQKPLEILRDINSRR